MRINEGLDWGGRVFFALIIKRLAHYSLLLKVSIIHINNFLHSLNFLIIYKMTSCYKILYHQTTRVGLRFPCFPIFYFFSHTCIWFNLYSFKTYYSVYFILSTIY